MSIITSNGHTYRIQQNTEVYRYDIKIDEKPFRVYGCLGEKDSTSLVGMLFVRLADKPNVGQYLQREYNAEEACQRLPDLYVAHEIDSKYGEDRINYHDYCLYTFITDAEKFKQCMEADHTTEATEPTNPDELIQEPLQEVENQEQPISDDTIESTTSSKTNPHKKKIGLAAVSSIILLTIPVGYAIIKGSNQQKENGSSSDTDSTIEFITPTTQKADTQLSSTIIETSESETTVVTTSSPPNLDFTGDGVVNRDDYNAFVNIYKKEFAPLHKKYEELSDEEHEKFDYLDLDNNKEINIYDGDEIKRQYE